MKQQQQTTLSTATNGAVTSDGTNNGGGRSERRRRRRVSFSPLLSFSGSGWGCQVTALVGSIEPTYQVQTNPRGAQRLGSGERRSSASLKRCAQGVLGGAQASPHLAWHNWQRLMKDMISETWASQFQQKVWKRIIHQHFNQREEKLFTAWRFSLQCLSYQ